MMKRSIYIFSAFFSLLNLNVLGQEDFYRLETKDVKYIIDTTEFNVISVDVTNSCKHNLILWLDKQDVTDLSLEHKIRHYFFTKKGDLSFAQLINDNTVGDFIPMLFISLVKKLQPGESFSFNILLNSSYEKDKITLYFKEHLVCFKDGNLKKYIDLKMLESFLYKSNSIILNYESLK